MSDAVSVCNGASFSGAVQVLDAGLCGMITLRGDLADEKLSAAVKAATGMGLPKPRRIKKGKRGAVAWMSPDELLIFVDYDLADSTVTKIERALQGQYFLAVNVSDARATFALQGTGVREVIAKGAPVDMSPQGLPVGEIRRTRLGQVAAAFWLSDEEHLTLVCFRSVGSFVYDWLCNAATEGTLPRLTG